MPTRPTTPPSRRGFLVASTAAVAASTLGIARSAHAAGGDTLRIALVGCGGRGTGAARQALRADKHVKLVAMADMFDDRLQLSLGVLQRQEDVTGKIDVPKSRQFVGFDAYKQVMAIKEVDVVLLATPPFFRPLHLKAAVEAGKHVFAEKPVAVDAPGVRSVLETCREAKKKNLSIVSGLCLRYSRGFQETIKRLHDGALGAIRVVQANDYRGTIWVKPRQPDWTDMHWQMRNWYYFTWLSGDFNVEQHVHYLDVSSWILGGQYPVKAIGLGGRQQRTGEQYGHIYDHHSVVYEFAKGEKLFSNCRQMRGCKVNISCHVMAEKGVAEVDERRFTMTTDQGQWKYDKKDKNFYQVEHDELFASIRSGKPINNGDYMAKSTLLAIMGRMATYTGQEITWEMAMNSKEDLTPERLAWGPIETPAVAMPGVTKFV